MKIPCMPAWIACPVCGFAMEADQCASGRPPISVVIRCTHSRCVQYEKRFEIDVPLLAGRALYEPETAA